MAPSVAADIRKTRAREPRPRIILTTSGLEINRVMVELLGSQ
jgi:hypothetical protein